MTAKSSLYLTSLLTALGFMLIGYDNVSLGRGEHGSISCTFARSFWH